MILEGVWFAVIALFLATFFLLEGFDYGVGILLPVLGKHEDDRSRVLASIAPFWDGNEVWLIAVGALIFVAFPPFYAALLSGFYLPFFVLLVALILRGAGFEFRGHSEDRLWRRCWETAIFVGSLLPAFIWGVALANLMRGVAINEEAEYVGGLAELFGPYAILGGLTTVALFTLHGANFLLLRTDGGLKERTHRVALWVGALATTLALAMVAATYLATDILTGFGVNPGVLPLAAGVALVSIRFLLVRHRYAWAFAMGSVTIALSTLIVFIGLWPRLIVSSLGPDESLTVTEAAAGALTLKVMLVVVVLMLPVIAAYQGWTYWVFRKRLTGGDLPYG